MTLEEKITQGIFQYIIKLSYNNKKASLEIEFVAGPDPNTGQKTFVNFEEVKEIQENWLEKDSDALEQLIGLDEEREQLYTKYFIQTDQRSISFQTSQSPVIKH